MPYLPGTKQRKVRTLGPFIPRGGGFKARKYSEDQERDDRGRWSSGSGGELTARQEQLTERAGVAFAKLPADIRKEYRDDMKGARPATKLAIKALQVVAPGTGGKSVV